MTRRRARRLQTKKFRRSANRTKKINLVGRTSRGGIRL